MPFRLGASAGSKLQAIRRMAIRRMVSELKAEFDFRNRRSLATAVLAVALLSVVFPNVTFAQAAIPLPVEDALKVRTFASWAPSRFSSDAKSFAYTVQDNQRRRSKPVESYLQTGVPQWGVGADIFVLNVESGDSRNLTGGAGDNWLPVWSPDGHYLAFLSDRGGDYARLWIWVAVRNE